VSFDYAKKEIDAPFLQNVLEQEARTEKVFEYHNEHVTTVPKGFLKVGESESCGIESLVSTDKRFWSFQFHPEYSSEYISSYEQREATYQQESTP
jgi:GMP synthase-like glutamine amidotransferase